MASDTSTIRVASGLHGPAERIRARSCLGCTLAKRWLLSAHQGAASKAHLAAYLNEFVFRFNRGSSRSRRLLFYRVLELAVAHDPVRYSDITAGQKPRAVLPTPPRTRGHPPSLDRPRRWR